MIFFFNFESKRNLPMKNKILLIEDNVEMAENISSILKLADYDVVSAANGKLGIEIAQQRIPDLIICDIMMPELDGYGVLHIVNNDPELSNIPFIFLTAKTEKDDIRTGMNLGADDYITKPFYGLDLLKVIEIRLRKSEQLKTNIQHGHPMLNGASSKVETLKELERLSEHKHVRLFRKKELIFMEGQGAFDLYLVASGEVKTYKVNYDGKELITGFHHAGDLLGYVSLLEGTPHHESAEVRKDAEITIIPKQDFIEMVYNSKNIARELIKLLSNNLIEAENRLLDIAYQSVRQRVAKALLNIHRISETRNERTVIAITRKDISNLIGTATESLNRTLADFKEEGLIEIRGEGIRILEKVKLERTANVQVMQRLAQHTNGKTHA